MMKHVGWTSNEPLGHVMWLGWPVTILTIFVLSIAYLIGTSRPVEVVNKAPTTYICEGTTMIVGNEAISNAEQCK